MRDRLVSVARAAIADCEGGRIVAAALAGHGPAWVAGAGKAVGGMAAGAARALGAGFRLGPLVGKDAARVDAALRPHFRDAGHPLPDARSERAVEALLAFFAARRADETVVLLLSGGASALLGAPIAGVSIAEMREATRTLLRSGLPIGEINAVRRHLGRVLGGRLAVATSASIDALALSDVVGDDPAAIGSGPVSPDPTRFEDALRVARRAGLGDGVLETLERGARGLLDETPKPGDPRLARVSYRIVATPRTLRERAAARAADAGLRPIVEPALIEDDVEALAVRYAARLDALATGDVLVAVGEPTVRVRGAGTGGRSQQLAGLLALALAGRRAAFVAVGSDGTDGPTDAAGAAVDGETAGRVSASGMDLRTSLAENDAYPLLNRIGALVRTGPTETNLLDLHLLAPEQ